MTAKGSSFSDYIFDFWNQNDITSMPIFLTTLILVWSSKSDAAVDLSYEKLATIKFFYILVVV